MCKRTIQLLLPLRDVGEPNNPLSTPQNQQVNHFKARDVISGC